MSRPSRWGLLLARTGCLLLLATSAARAQGKPCFFPNGGIHTQGQACDPDADSFVPCCEETHLCLSNNLCWDVQNNHVVRGSCTDPTFDDAACPHYCTGAIQGGRLGDLRQCPGSNDEWSCTQNVTGCDGAFAVAFGYVNDRRATNNIIADGTDSNGTDSNGTAAGGGSGAASDPGSCSDVGLGAGLGAGVPLLLALAPCLFFLVRARRQLAAARADGAPGHHHLQQRSEYKLGSPPPPPPPPPSSTLVHAPSSSSHRHAYEPVAGQPYRHESPSYLAAGPAELEHVGRISEADGGSR